MNILYTCLSAKITNEFESKNIKFQRILYAETGKLEGSNMWVFKTGPQSYTLNRGQHRDSLQIHMEPSV